MKKFLALALALCMVLALAATASAAPKELKWGSVHTEDHLATQMMMMAIDEINANAEGIHVTGFPNSVLGGSQDLVEGVQEGIVDIITEGPVTKDKFCRSRLNIGKTFNQRVIHFRFQADDNSISKAFLSVDLLRTRFGFAQSSNAVAVIHG